MVLGLWPSPCYFLWYTATSKSFLNIDSWLFFLLLSLSPSPTPPQNAKKFSHPTFVAMHVCVNLGLYFPSLMHVRSDPAPAVCAGCCMMNSFTRNMLRVRADPLGSDFSGATRIHGAKPLLSRLCVTQLFCLRRHRLAALLCILL